MSAITNQNSLHSQTTEMSSKIPLCLISKTKILYREHNAINSTERLSNIRVFQAVTQEKQNCKETDEEVYRVQQIIMFESRAVQIS